ncbi:MAG TPA: PilN domain-containing protein [Terriglobales bacterium]|nr:PilN domain-containing protein [Terriglobales bacterium]
MIRINLLGATKQKKGKRAAISGGESATGVLLGSLLIVLIALGGNGAYYWKLQHDADSLQNRLSAAENENLRLSQVKAVYLEREKIKNNYKRRVDVIDQLRTNQFGPVSLLNTISNTINSTDEVWLNTMNDDGKAITLKGVALSVHGVADLIRNLQRTGYFKTVEIKETFQDDSVKDMQAFLFTIICEKQPAQKS